MTQQLILRNATLADGSHADVVVNSGVITHIGGQFADVECENVVDLSGYLLNTSLAEPHAHLDKAFLADRVFNPAGDLMGAIHGLELIRESITYDDIVARAVRAAVLMSQNGVTSVRTHADVTLSAGLSSLRALLHVKQQCSSFMDIQVAALVEWPLTGTAGAERRALARDAIAEGADVVGGCPHLDPSPTEAVEVLLQLALESGLPLDLHADENMRPSSRDLETLADLLLRDSIVMQANASHCVSLSTVPEHEACKIAAKVAAAGITVTALPQTNLFLQERDAVTRAARAITPISLLLKEGVTVSLGADNLQDPFNLVGRADPLETASLAVIASHVTPEIAFDLVSTQAHQVIHNTPQKLSSGERANLLALKATNVREAVAMGSPDRFVVYGGVVITNHKRNKK
jgi:cytosine deaminase